MATVTVTEANFETLVTESDVLVLDFWASWCGPCRSFAPIYESASEKHTDIVFGKVDTEDQQELAAAFGIQSIPTTAYFRDGILLHKQPGLLQMPDLEGILTQLKALDMDAIRAEIAEHEAHHHHDGSCDHEH